MFAAARSLVRTLVTLLACCLVLSYPAFADSISTYWTGTGSGNWGDPNGWDNGVPNTSSFLALSGVIDPNNSFSSPQINAILDGSYEIGGLTAAMGGGIALNGYTLTVDNNVSAGSNMSLTGPGTLSAGTFTNSQTLTIQSAALTVTGQFDNSSQYGSLQLVGSTASVGDLLMSSTSQVNVDPSSTLTVTGGTSFLNGTGTLSGQYTIDGLFQYSGSGITTIGSGSDGTTVSLGLTSGGSAAISNTGSTTSSALSTLNTINGNLSLGGSASVTTGGDLTVNSTGQLNVEPTASFSVSGSLYNYGAVSASGGSPGDGTNLSVTGTFDNSVGSGSLTISQTAVNVGDLAMAPTASVTINGYGSLTVASGSNNTFLGGAATLSGQYSITGALNYTGSGITTIGNSDGTIVTLNGATGAGYISNDGTSSNSALATLNTINDTFTIMDGASVTTNGDLTVNGTLNVNSAADGTNNGGGILTVNGQLSVASSAGVNLNGGQYGGGSGQLSAASYQNAGSLTVGGALDGLSGPGMVTVTNAFTNQTSASVMLGGGANGGGGATMTVGSLQNDGTVTVQGAVDNNVFTPLVGSSYTATGASLTVFGDVQNTSNGILEVAAGINGGAGGTASVDGNFKNYGSVLVDGSSEVGGASSGGTLTIQGHLWNSSTGSIVVGGGNSEGGGTGGQLIVGTIGATGPVGGGVWGGTGPYYALANAGTITIQGEQDPSSGAGSLTVYGNYKNTSTGTLNVLGGVGGIGATGTVIGDFLNNGTTNVGDGNTCPVEIKCDERTPVGGGTLAVTGQFVNGASGAVTVYNASPGQGFYGGLLTAGSFQNNGTVTVGQQNDSQGLIKKGTIGDGSGGAGLIVTGQFTNAALASVTVNGGLDGQGGGYLSAGSFSNSGSLTVNGGSYSRGYHYPGSGNGSVNVDGGFYNHSTGTVTLNGGTNGDTGAYMQAGWVRNSGLITVAGGDGFGGKGYSGGAFLGVYGDFHNSSNGTLDVQAGTNYGDGGTAEIAGSFHNSGIVTIDSATDGSQGGGLAVLNTLWNSHSGSITISGGAEGFGGGELLAGLINNWGTVTIQGAQDNSLGAAGDLETDVYTQYAGSTTVDGTLEASLVDIIGGMLGGGGVITASNVDIEAGGTLAPGDPQMLSIDSNVDLAGTLDIEVAGLGDNDSIYVLGGGDLTLGGTLDMDFLSSYTPHAGDQFIILDWNGSVTESGNFASIIATNLTAGFGLEEVWDFSDSAACPVSPATNNSSFGTCDSLAIEIVAEATTGTPEPGSLLLLGTGIASLLAARRLRRSKTLK